MSEMPEPSADITFDLRFKIISCRKLLKGDRNSSDPYVKIMLGKRELHRTKHMLKTLNPVFGTQHENAFSEKVNYGVLKAVGGISIEVKDWDRIGTNDLIGLCKIPPAELLELAKNGKLRTVRLQVPPGRKETDAGFITLSVQDIGDDSDGWSSSESEKAPDDNVAAPLPNLDFRTSIVDAMGTSHPPYDKELFIEIMSCRNLIAGDSNGTSDPYVEIKMGSKVLHTTLWIQNTLNPAYSVDHKNIYILKCTAKVLWSNGGIELLVKDHDVGISAFGMTDDELGYCKIPAQKLYEYNGEYSEFKLQLPRNSKLGVGATSAGSISIRVRESKLEDEDEKAAAEVAAVAAFDEKSEVEDDRDQWDAEAAYSVIKPKREKLYVEDSESSSDSSDMYMESTDEERQPKKPTSFGAAAAVTQSDDSSDEEMPEPTGLAEQTTSKWGNQKGVGGRGGRGELYVPSMHPGDMFDKEIEALEEKHMDTSDDDTNASLDPKQTVNDMWEQMVEKDARIKELQQEVDVLKDENKELRMELKKSRYTRKTNKPPKKKKSSKVPLAAKVPLAKKRVSNGEEEQEADTQDKAPKVEVTAIPKSALKQGKFSALDFDGPSDDDTACTGGTAEKPKEEEITSEKPGTGFRSLDFGLDAPTFSSDESDDGLESKDKAPERGITPIKSIISPQSTTRGTVLAPTRGIPGVRLSEIGQDSSPKSAGTILAPTRGIPGVRLSEIEPETTSPKEPASPDKRGVRFHSKSPPRSPTRSVGNSTDSSDEDLSPNRGLLGKMGLTDSLVGRFSLYSFIQTRSNDEDTLEGDGVNCPPDFDRKHKDMQFAQMDFCGIAASKDKESLRNVTNAMPSLAFNPSNIIPRDEDSDEERRRNMVGVSVDKDWERSSSRSLGSNLEQTTTTVLSQTAIHQTKISGRRVFELEQQVQELKEELELALANPGGYEKASLEVQLKVAHDSKKQLEADNERLQKMNKIQKMALFEMSTKNKGFW
ncbi:MAG: hypothetical protein SGBAC_012904 [Bacillariaceae sp.]